VLCGTGVAGGEYIDAEAMDDRNDATPLAVVAGGPEVASIWLPTSRPRMLQREPPR
jgi:hypothetical protein